MSLCMKSMLPDGQALSANFFLCKPTDPALVPTTRDFKYELVTVWIFGQQSTHNNINLSSPEIFLVSLIYALCRKNPNLLDLLNH